MSKQAFQVDRIAFFSDAVLAIAITLMIIEVKPPHMHGGHGDVAAFFALMPMFLGVAISFAFIGVFWYRHHQLFGHIVNYDTKLIVRNMIFLGTTIFIPFSTAFNFENTAGSHVPMVVYNLNYMLASIACLMLFRYALDPASKLSTPVPADELRDIRSELEFPIVIFGVIAVIALFIPTSAPIFYALFGFQSLYKKIRR